MKKIYMLLFVLATLMLTIPSCDLEKYPYSDIEQSQSIKSLQDAKSLNNGLYAFLRNCSYGIFMYTTDVQADLLNASLDYGNRNGQPHQWTSFLSEDYTIRDSWFAYYQALSNVNNFLENAPKVGLADDKEKATMDQYLGEAYLMRAYYFHQLVQRWAKDYEPSTAKTDPGIPVVLSLNIYALPSRSSVEDTYTQIQADLSKAKQLLANVKGEAMSIRLTIDCAIALEARVKLCMHDWTGAKNAADALINGANYPLINSESEFKDMWGKDRGSEIIMHAFASTPDELGRANEIYLGFDVESGKYSPDFIPQKWVVDLFADNDIRKNAYLEKKPIRIQGLDYPELYLVNKYPGNPKLFATAGVTNYQHMPILFRIAEMYLISAEAAAQVPSTEAAALATLNTLRTNRGLSKLENLSSDDLKNAIQVERTRELLCEGSRLDDLKRWKKGFKRQTPQNDVIIVNGVDYDKKEVQANDNKFVWGLPKNDIATNPNLANSQNPGW